MIFDTLQMPVTAFDSELSHQSCFCNCPLVGLGELSIDDGHVIRLLF